MNRYSKPIIRPIYHMIYEKKVNCLVGITGRVGTGKSHLAVLISYIFDSKFDIEKSLVYTVEDLIERSLANIKFKGKPLSIEELRKIPNVREWLNANIQDIYIHPGHALVFDEAGTGAYVREFFSQDNKTISKIIQIWRILRMLVIFVVPEDLSLAESTITRFLNLEIKCNGIEKDEKGPYAPAIAWKYKGYNKRTKEPIKQRLNGCKYGGIFKIRPLPSFLAERYEELSKVYKIDALVQMGRQYNVDRPIKVASTRTIYDDIEYVKANVDKFKNQKGQLTQSSIKLGLGVSHHKASMIQQAVLQDKPKEKTPPHMES